MDDSSALSEASRPPTPQIKWINAVRAANRLAQKVAGATLIAIMLMVVVNVVGRRFLNSPVAGTVELTEIGMVLVVYLSLAYAEDNRDHIVVDLVFDRLPPVIRRVLASVAGIATILVAALLAWQLYNFTLRMKAGGFSTPILAIPLWLVAAVAVFGAAMFALSAAANALLAAKGVTE
jgi:TRAP-type C4-dicarboxylate transport system permease small subunit